MMRYDGPKLFVLQTSEPHVLSGDGVFVEDLPEKSHLKECSKT